MSHIAYRQLYQPKAQPARPAPAWLRRLWAWL